MNLPNRITMFRITLIPLLILIWLFPYEHFGISVGHIQVENVFVSYVNVCVAVIFLIASISDFIDGYIARNENMVTTLGKFADPIADKLLVNTLLLLLVYDGFIPILPVIIMIARDIVVDGARILGATNGVIVSAGYLGKVKTVLQFITIGLVLLSNLPFELYSIPLDDILLWSATFASLASGISYCSQLKEYIFESI